ncbi:MAG: tail fiber domain-containing protein [Oscillochloris sp.]|nr:tail fiber domain-containing protein [Oscillochloris sp.]
MKKQRGILKDYFKKGAIPKESDFADLIDSVIIQDEDSIFKPANNALSVVGIGAEEELLSFYRPAEEPERSWQLKQRSGGKNGLSIHDATAGRLFIESGSGNVGLGTNSPTARLEVSGGGGATVDLIVNGRMRSNNNDGGLWVSDNRFVGGHGTDQIGFWNGNAWRLTVLNNGDVGIGSTAVHNPQGWNRVLDILGTSHARLNVRSSGGVVTSIFSHDNWGGARGVIGTDSNHPLTFATNYTHHMTLDTNGNLFMARPNLLMMGNTDGSATRSGALLGAIGFVGMGATHAQMVYRAGSGGGFEFVDRSKNGPALNNDNTGWAKVSGILNNASSRRWKDTITAMAPDDALAALNELRPVTFRYTNDQSERVQAGFIAEEVPDLLASSNRDVINPLEVVAVLTSVLQTQRQTIAELSGRLQVLEAQR